MSALPASSDGCPAVASVEMQFCCGIDIGVKNLAISFVEYVPDSVKERFVVSYKGTLEVMQRFVKGLETETFVVPGGKKMSHHEAYVNIFEMIPQFAQTVSTVIEIQLAAGRSDMSRLDGVAYGFLRGRFPSMDVHLNGSTIRKKFTAERITQSGVNPDEVIVPRGYPETKHQSFLFVGCVFPSYYAFLLSLAGLDKLDDLCDSIVYASIAFSNYAVEKMLSAMAVGTKQRKR